MKNKILPALYLLVCGLFLANCVREIDFSKDNTDTETLVVRGTFTDGPGPHILRLVHPGDAQKQLFEPVSGALVALSDDQGNRYGYQEILSADGQTAYYRLAGVMGVPGRTYSLEIRLPNGEVFQSHPETMPVPVPIDSLQMQGEWQVSNNTDGTVVREPYAYAYVQATVPQQAKGRYLRWDSEGVYIFNEVPKTYNPFDVQRQCFITNRLSDQLVPLADLGALQQGAVIREKAGKRRIDHAFEHRFCVTVYQRTINRNAYEYWQKISQLIAPTGTVFDLPPARIFGNLDNVTHPERPALGWFEIAAVDTARLYTRNGQLGDAFLLQENPYCNYDWSHWPPVNHPECDDCRTLPSSSLEKPIWWE